MIRISSVGNSLVLNKHQSNKTSLVYSFAWAIDLNWVQVCKVTFVLPYTIIDLFYIIVHYLVYIGSKRGFFDK